MNDKNLETLKFLKKISQVNKLSYNFYSVRNQANTLGSGAILTGQEVWNFRTLLANVDHVRFLWGKSCWSNLQWLFRISALKVEFDAILTMETFQADLLFVLELLNLKVCYLYVQIGQHWPHIFQLFLYQDKVTNPFRRSNNNTLQNERTFFSSVPLAKMKEMAEFFRKVSSLSNSESTSNCSNFFSFCKEFAMFGYSPEKFYDMAKSWRLME